MLFLLCPRAEGGYGTGERCYLAFELVSDSAIFARLSFLSGILAYLALVLPSVDPPSVLLAPVRVDPICTTLPTRWPFAFTPPAVKSQIFESEHDPVKGLRL